MAAGGPEVGDGGADGGVVPVGVLVDVTSVLDLALSRRVDAVYLAAREGLQLVHPELLSEGVDARMLKKLVTGLVDGGYRRI